MSNSELKVRITRECAPFQAGEVITVDADFIFSAGLERAPDDAVLTRKTRLLGRAALTALLDQRSVVVKGTWACFASDAERQELIDYLAQ